jgi:hypothetical protein
MIPEYIRSRNESKSRWVRYGKTSSSTLKDAEAKPLTGGELKREIRELHFEMVERIVKQNDKVKFEER